MSVWFRWWISRSLTAQTVVPLTPFLLVLPEGSFQLSLNWSPPYQ